MVDMPRNDERGGRECDAVCVERPESGGKIGEAAVRKLRVLHIPDPLRIKRGGAEHVHLALRFLCPVSKPPLPLVSLRAVRWNASVVPSHTPVDAVVDPVQQGL